MFSQTNICFVGTLRPPGTSPCPASVAVLQQIILYDNTTNFGYGDLMVTPIKRVTFNMGYAINSVNGSTLILNPTSPPGPLQFNYHKPYASVAINLYRGLSWKGGWGFYDYNEKGERTDPTGPRSFRGNLVTLSMVYAF